MDKQINETSRTASSDHDESADQIGNDTPRSGIATPEPDPQDKRLPGIMSYFGQVSRSSFTRLWSSTPSAPTGAASQVASTANQSRKSEHGQQQESSPSSQLPVSPPEPASRTSSEDQGPPLLPHERVGLSSEDRSPETSDLHPYPTPPASSRSSMRGAKVGEISGEGAGHGATAAVSANARKTSVADLSGLKGRRPSMPAAVTSVQVNDSTVHASHFSNPGSRRVSTSHNSPVHAHFTPAQESSVSENPASVRRLKELTNETASKSGQSTPNRSLSTAQPAEQPARHDGQEGRRTSNESSSATGTQTPESSTVPAAKGKLTIKISEARGLRKCRAPYVVAVFQRSELISGNPREDEEDEEAAVSNVAMGGVPIQRQASDSGRTPMAIPMRSRQSSNTSTGEFNSFRNRTQRRSFTNPKWDAEAVL